MADVWDSIGVDIAQDEGNWLYRIGAQICGPFPYQYVVDKLVQGQIPLDAEVARGEGAEFYPIQQVKAFAEHLVTAQQQRLKLAQRKRRKRVLAMLSVLLVLVLAGAGLFWWIYQQRSAEQAVAHAAMVKLAAEKAKLAQSDAEAAAKAAPAMKLVGLVSLGSESDVAIAKPKASASNAQQLLNRAQRKANSGRNKEEAEPAEPIEEEIASCRLSQQQIFGTLRNYLAQLNVCVEDEKGRDKDSLLPPVLQLSFVVKTTGRVTDFAIDDRHYRTGPLNNCLLKVFGSITFPSSTGANCPVTIPIKIAK